MRKVSKFFIICGAVCVIGIIMAAAGYAMGGVEDMEKVADRYDWMSAGPGEMQQETVTDMEFDAIESHGNIDLVIIGLGSDAYSDDWGLDEMNIEGLDPGSVVVNYGSAVGAPDVSVEEGVLKINSESEPVEMEVNISGEDVAPDVIIFCGEDDLKSINIENDYGDVALAGISCKDIIIKNDTGDIEIDQVKSSGMNLSSDVGDIEVIGNGNGSITAVSGTGDIELKGSMKCDVNATVDTGDIEFETDLAQDRYEITLLSELNDISVNEKELDTAKYSAGGSPHKLTLQTGAGSIDVNFGTE